MALFKPMVGPNDNIGKATKVAGQLLMTYDKGYLYIDTLNPNNNLVTRWTINPDLQDMSGTLTINKGGTGATTAEGARSNLGLGSAAIVDILAADSTILNNKDSTKLVSAAQVSNYVSTKITEGFSANDAMRLKGTVGAVNGNPLKTWPPATYEVGDTYKVADAGTYSGQECEVGDMLICIQNYKEGSASNADWAVVQNNITVAINSGSKAGLAAYYDQTNSISAIDLTTLDVTENGTSITAITSVTQDSKGKITVNKATISGVKPAAHTHGNITDDGKIGSTAGLAIVTTTEGTLAAVDLKVSTASSTSGTVLSFVDSITQDSRGQINFTKKDIPTVIGANDTQAGTKGLVPAAAIGQQTYLLTGAGTWMKPYSNGAGLLLDSNNVFSLNTSGVTAGNYGPSKDITLSTTTDGKFNVPYITVDTYGRITTASTKTITMDAIVWGTF